MSVNYRFALFATPRFLHVVLMLSSFYPYSFNDSGEFNSNWGNFFLAFLFNQMGNALNFQAKFTSISENRAKQNYMGVWQEYGDLFYLIY